MEVSGSSDIPHVAIHDHKIKIPGSGQDSISDGKLLGLVAISNNKVDKAMLLRAYINQYEKSGRNPKFISEARKLLSSGNREVQVHYYYNTDQYNKIISIATELKPSKCEDPWTMYRISNAYSHLDQPSNAEFWLDSLAVKAPYNLDFMNELVSVKMQLKKFSEAKRILERLEKLQSTYEKTLVNQAYYYYLTNNLGLSKRYCQKALDQNPDSQAARNILNMIDGDKAESTVSFNR